MIASAIALAISITSAPEAEEFSIDLFLVGNNPAVVTELGWLKDGNTKTPIQDTLYPALKPLAEEKKSFVLIDGGDCSIFPQAGKQIEGSIIQRQYDSYPSASESITVNGKTKTRVLAYNETESTSMSGYYPRPIMKDAGYMAHNYIHFQREPEKLFLAVQDLNSYKTTITRGTAQDKECLGKTLLLSSGSIRTSQQFLKENRFDFDGVCISAWGIADQANPNFISFPPEGKAAHYKLFRQGGKWGVRLVGYLG